MREGQYWREKAERSRAAADQLSENPAAKHLMSEIADSYEKLAINAELRERPKSNGVVPVDAANATKIAGDIELPDGGLAALQSFAPTGYFAVTVR
jgi:hypothetical protein